MCIIKWLIFCHYILYKLQYDLRNIYFYYINGITFLYLELEIILSQNCMQIRILTDNRIIVAAHLKTIVLVHEFASL